MTKAWEIPKLWKGNGQVQTGGEKQGQRLNGFIHILHEQSFFDRACSFAHFMSF